VENLDPAVLSRFTMDRTSEEEARALVTTILSGALGRRLATWEMTFSR
jgi:hypothetical protein